MKALAYTLVLAFVLVGVVVFLYSIQPDKPEVERPEPIGTPTRMVVRSKPAIPPGIDTSELEEASVEELYRTGLELLDLWHLPEAIEVFEALREMHPEYLDTYLRLVECYSDPMVGEEKRASECVESAMELAVDSEADTLLVAALNHLFIEGSAPTALRLLDQLDKKARADMNIRHLVASAYLMNGDPEAARAQLEPLLEEDQSLGRARELLVRCHAALGDYETAEALAKELAAIYSEEPYPYVLLSRVLLLQGKIVEAVEFCNNALLLDGRYIPAIVARGHLYVAEGDLEAARVSFEKLQLFADPVLSSIGIEGKAYVDFLAGRFDAAEQEMDEAIRLTMSIESTRRGLFLAFRLVDYLCELGRADAAEAVLDRWMAHYGVIPRRLGELRVRISRGSPARVRSALDSLQDDEVWRTWIRLLAVDLTGFRALTYIQENDYSGALAVLNESDVPGETGTRRSYLKGYALFQNGQAESAVSFFEETRFRFHGLIFPYHGDPVLYVQSVFYLAEAALARGDVGEARSEYEEFLAFWGDADWELQAVNRAREKLEALTPEPANG